MINLPARMIEIVLISMALAADCLTVSVAAGVTARRPIWHPMTLMVLAFGIFQGGMTAIGYYSIQFLADWIQAFEHWIAFVLLGYIGFNMISTIWHKDEYHQIDLLSIRNIIALAFATSIDAFAIGISFACTGFHWSYAIVIALISSLASAIGLGTGIQLGRRIPFPAEPVGGIVLILIGIKILTEHLC